MVLFICVFQCVILKYLQILTIAPQTPVNMGYVSMERRIIRVRVTRLTLGAIAQVNHTLFVASSLYNIFGAIKVDPMLINI